MKFQAIPIPGNSARNRSTLTVSGDPAYFWWNNWRKPQQRMTHVCKALRRVIFHGSQVVPILGKQWPWPPHFAYNWRLLNDVVHSYRIKMVAKHMEGNSCKSIPFLIHVLYTQKSSNDLGLLPSHELNDSSELCQRVKIVIYSAAATFPLE